MHIIRKSDSGYCSATLYSPVLLLLIRRTNLLDIYQKKCAQEGTPLVESATAIEYDEYKYTQKSFFTRQKYEEYAYCGLDLAMVGRVSEGIDVYWNMFKVHSTFYHLQTTWYRGKSKTICTSIH